MNLSKVHLCKGKTNIWRESLSEMSCLICLIKIRPWWVKWVNLAGFLFYRQSKIRWCYFGEKKPRYSFNSCVAHNMNARTSVQVMQGVVPKGVSFKGSWLCRKSYSEVPFESWVSPVFQFWLKGSDSDSISTVNTLKWLNLKLKFMDKHFFYLRGGEGWIISEWPM